ncbi:SDR family NAD(P)-dependent oxidoreductase [Mycolicibacterium anyangense]|nr:glucose 1-dehydrogenase [Mycolicibacterium anyangense]
MPRALSKPDGEARSVIDLFRLDGRVAVVTGASSGLGAGFARTLAESGANVVLAARRVEELTRTAGAVRQHGRRALVVSMDVCDPASCEAAAAQAVSEFGRLDILINNAGISAVAPALQQSVSEFRRVIDVNLVGAYQMACACAQVMEPGASIVNVASVMGLSRSLLPQAAYSASKAGLIGLTRDLANQWTGRRGIRVNALAPGFIETEMTAELTPEWRDRLVGACPIPRFAEQREIDAAMLFLASPASSYITATTLVVDGGMTGH